MFGNFRASTAIQACVLWLAAAVFLIAASESVVAQPGHSTASAKRIKFSRGSICGTAAGVLLKRTSRYYFVVHANAGQQMIVNVVPTSAPLATVGIVLFPGGEQDGSPGGVVFDSKLTHTGDYRIQVSAHNMADNRFPGKFRVEVVIH